MDPTLCAFVDGIVTEGEGVRAVGHDPVWCVGIVAKGEGMCGVGHDPVRCIGVGGRINVCFAFCVDAGPPELVGRGLRSEVCLEVFWCVNKLLID